jgi:hypothetical protein
MFKQDKKKKSEKGVKEDENPKCCTFKQIKDLF